METSCPHCHRGVDLSCRSPDGIYACPHCGEGFFHDPSDPAVDPEIPLAAAPAPPTQKRNIAQERTGPVQVIELTAKRYKLMQLRGAGLFLVGGLILLYLVHQADAGRPPHNPWGSLAVVVSFLAAAGGGIYYLVGRVLAWWHHG